MILAAGLGTRLRPLTDDRPKALVEVSGRTLLEITLSRLRAFGISQVIINVHHFADLMLDYLNAHDNFGMEIEISREDTLLDTGGGLKKAAHFFRDSAGGQPFLLHNVDVISDVDLQRMVQFHHDQRALATLAVQDRKTSRYLLFDDSSRLCGRKSELPGKNDVLLSSQQLHPLAFCGIHIISSRFLEMVTEEGVFPIIDSYVRLAAQGEKVVAFRADQYYWRDLGKPENILQAEEDLKRKLIVR